MSAMAAVAVPIGLKAERTPEQFALLLTRDGAARYVGVATSTLYEIEAADPTFPAPVHVPGTRTLWFRREDLRAWVRSLKAADLKRKVG